MARLHHSTSAQHGPLLAHSSHIRTRESIKRGIITQFFPATYTADILIMEATSTVIQGVPVACHLDGTSAQVNALCAVLFFDEQNYTDAVVLAVYPNGSQGIPVPAPGRVVFLATPYTVINAVVINAGVTNTYTVTNVGGIPMGALGVLFKAILIASAAPAHLDFAAHGGDLSRTVSLGNVTSATQTLNGGGILPVDGNGQIDIKANSANCTTTFYIYGYVF